MTDADWTRLDGLGLWQRIDAACGCLIDCYEEEWIAPGDLGRLLSVLAEIGGTPAAMPEGTATLVDSLRRLVTRADSRAAPVIFSL